MRSGVASMHLSLSESESRRFGLVVCRGGKLTPAETDAFLAECAAMRTDVAILRMAAQDAASLIPALTPKCQTIPADMLLEFRKPLNQRTVADALNSGAEITELHAKNIDLLDGLVERCYADYTNHYHSNPCLDHAAILPGLIEFSRNFVARDDRTVFIASRAGKPCGYLCMDISDGVGSSVIGGSALDIPALLRHKILCDLTHHGDLWLLRRGVAKFSAVTRTDKIYIQKLLVHNMHCLPAGALTTVHVNLFLAAMQNDPVSATEGRSMSNALLQTKTLLRAATGPVERRAITIQHEGKKFQFAAESDKTGIMQFESCILPS